MTSQDRLFAICWLVIALFIAGLFLSGCETVRAFRQFDAPLNSEGHK
jgi:hypothetical protein